MFFFSHKNVSHMWHTFKINEIIVVPKIEFCTKTSFNMDFWQIMKCEIKQFQHALE